MVFRMGRKDADEGESETSTTALEISSGHENAV